MADFVGLAAKLAETGVLVSRGSAAVLEWSLDVAVGHSSAHGVLRSPLVLVTCGPRFEAEFGFAGIACGVISSSGALATEGVGEFILLFFFELFVFEVREEGVVGSPLHVGDVNGSTRALRSARPVIAIDGVGGNGDVHLVVESPGEVSEHVGAVLVDNKGVVALSESGADELDVGVAVLSVELSSDVVGLVGVDGVFAVIPRVGAIASGEINTSTAGSLLSAGSEFAWLRLDSEVPDVGFHDVDAGALRSDTLGVLAPSALFVVKVDSEDSSGASAGSVTDINIK